MLVLYSLPTLEFLDSTAVSAHERRDAELRGPFLHVVRPPDDMLRPHLAVHALTQRRVQLVGSPMQIP